MAEEWTVKQDEAARRFEVALGDEKAVLNYSLRGGALVITHTGVPPAWEGRGIAASLTRVALEYAHGAGTGGRARLLLCSDIHAETPGVWQPL